MSRSVWWFIIIIIIIIIIIVKHPHFNQLHHPIHHSPFSSLPRFSLRRDIYHLSTLVEDVVLVEDDVTTSIFSARKPSSLPKGRRWKKWESQVFLQPSFQDRTWFQLTTFFKYPPNEQVPYPTKREKEHHRLKHVPFLVEDMCDRSQEGRFSGPNPEWTGLYQAHCNLSSPNLFRHFLHHRDPAVALTPAKRWPRPSSVRGINNPGQDGSGTHQRDTIWHPSDNTIMWHADPHGREIHVAQYLLYH